MKKLTLLAMKEDCGRLIKALQKTQAVHVISSELCASSFEDPEYQRQQDKKARLTNAFTILEPYSKKPGLLEPRPIASPSEIENSISDAFELLNAIERLAEEKNNLLSKKDKLAANFKALSPWKNLETPLDEIRPTKSIRYIAGHIRSERLLSLTLPTLSSMEVYGAGDGTLQYVLIAAHESAYSETLTALRDVDFTEVSLSGYSGTAFENLISIQKTLNEISVRLDGIDSELKAIAETNGMATIKEAIDGVSIGMARSEAMQRLGATHTVFTLEGWIRNYDEELVRNAINSVAKDCYIEIRNPSEDENPPTALKNGKFVEPFESVTNMYSPPAYKGIDATPFMMPFYLLFFGIMLGDTGYGLVLTLGTFLYLKLKRPSGMFGQTVKVIMYCGISTMLCGLFVGTFFGMSWQDMPIVGNFLPILFDPMDQIMPMMLISCGLGLFQMMFGIGIKMYMCFRDGDWQSAIFDQFPWMLFIPGLIVMLADGFIDTIDLSLVGQIMVFTGAGLILLFSNRKTLNPIKRIGSGLWNLYGSTSWIGDILSYVRIFALGLVTGAMGMVFNLMGGMIFNGLSSMGVFGIIAGFIAAAVILVATHGFSMFINVLGTYVHCARLQYVEFFGKYYIDNGTLFTPLAYPTKNIEVKMR